MFEGDIRIDGFVNIEHRRWIRWVRRNARENLADLWRDSACVREYDAANGGTRRDIFCLRKLFDLEPYDGCEERTRRDLANLREDAARARECDVDDEGTNRNISSNMERWEVDSETREPIHAIAREG